MISTLINRLLLCWLILWPLCGKAEFVTDSKPQQWLMDTTDLLTAHEKETIINSLFLFNKNKGRKLVVLVVNTTGKESIDKYAINAFNSFHMAHENKDNDILLLLDWSEKRAHIERGYVSTSGAQFSSSTRSSSQYGFHQNSLIEGINTGIRLAGGDIHSTQPFTNAAPTPSNSNSVKTPGQFEQIAIPALTPPLTDITEILTPYDTRKILSSISVYEKKFGYPIAVLVVPTTGGIDIDLYASHVFQRWELGQADKDNAILLLLSWKDKKEHIEVGNNLKDLLAQTLSSGQINLDIQYGFISNDLALAINKGIHATIWSLESALARANIVTPRVSPQAKESSISRHDKTPTPSQPASPQIQEKESLISRLVSSSSENPGVSAPITKRPPIENPNRLHVLFFISWIVASFALPWAAKRYFSTIAGIISGIGLGATIFIYWHLTLSDIVEPGLLIIGLVITAWFALAATDMPDGPAFRSLKVAYEILVFIARIMLIFRGSSGGKGGGGSSGGFNGGGGGSGGGGASGRW